MPNRKPLYIAVGVAAAGALVAGGIVLTGGKNTSSAQPANAAGTTGANTAATATADPSTAAVGSSSATAPDSATDSAATPAASSSSGGTGALASDGTTRLASFPSLTKISDALGSSAAVTTTIDPRYQNAAAAALAKYPNSAMVVLRADTGEILAMASHGAADLAYHAQLAPGSTFKVVTTEDLLRNGVRASDPAPCKAHDDEYDVSNDDTSLTNSHADLGWAFTYSCNTSFTGLLGHLSGSPLDAEASTYFGLNQPWDLGLGPATYGASGAANVPEATGGDFAREMFGQGKITVSPLNMASIAATVATGSFHQPILVPGTKPSAHARPLEKDVAATLRTLMRRVVTEGTAHSLRGVSPAVSAKTGTAEPGGGAANNSWMIAFQGDVAVACLVEGGGHGDDAAGPAIAAMLGAVR